MDRGAWQVQSTDHKRVEHNLATKQQQQQQNVKGSPNRVQHR